MYESNRNQTENSAAPKIHSPPLPDSSQNTFVNVTSLFHDAARGLDYGELMHTNDFRLHDAMLAIELMDPQMDMGMHPQRTEDEDGDIRMDSGNGKWNLNEREVLKLTDVMLGALASWLDGGGLGETIYGCVYLVRKEILLLKKEVKILDCQMKMLRVFLKGIESLVAFIKVVVTNGEVAEEEDFSCGWNADIIEIDVDEYVGEVEEVLGHREEEKNCTHVDVEIGLRARIEFIKELYVIVSRWKEKEGDGLCEVSEVSRDAERSLRVIKDTTGLAAKALPKAVFDRERNRYRAANVPPRNVALMKVEDAINYFTCLIAELRALASYKTHLLPRAELDVSGFSFHCMVHAIAYFSMRYKPGIVTRSLLKSMVFNSNKYPFREQNAVVPKMLFTDMGLIDGAPATRELSVIVSLIGHAHLLQATLCRNRGRQHRYLLDFLVNWDRIASYLMGIAEEQAKSSLIDKAAKKKRAFTDGRRKTPKSKSSSHSAEFEGLKLMFRGIACRAMTIYFFLGFECDLYSPSEFPVVYFYASCAFTNLILSTETSMKDGEWFGARQCLHHFDEGRSILCQAFMSLLEALSESDKWEYCWRLREKQERAERKVYGGKKLWYQQRFFDVGDRIFGPRYVSYEAFVDTVSRRKDLAQDASKRMRQDVFVVRLSEAAQSFRKAREKLDRVRKQAKILKWEPVAEEAVSLTRVAIANLIAVTRFSEVHKSGYASSSVPIRINFDFGASPHFPIIGMTAT